VHDLTCVIHVHSIYSDGTATVSEIACAARRTGADAVLLTDHDSREAARQGWEGWHDGVLVVVGHEVTTRRGHLLAFDLEREIQHQGLSETEICARVRAQGGFGFAAHPFSRGGFVRSIVRPHPWSALDECQDCGVEIWSVVTDAAERWRSARAAWRFMRDPVGELEGPPREHLMQWDRLCAERRVPAIAGLDAHQSGLRVAGHVLSPMPHERYFALVRTHVLLDAAPVHDAASDRRAVYAALREGRCYVGFDALADATGFAFTATLDDGQLLQMGEEAPAQPAMVQCAASHPCTLELVRNGHVIATAAGHRLSHAITQPGAYRMQAHLSFRGRKRTWIVSNPIYLRQRGQHRAQE
jgi:hypothetical protein